MLKSLAGVRDWPLGDRLYLSGVWFNPPGRDDMAKERNRFCVEFALLHFDKQLVL